MENGRLSMEQRYREREQKFKAEAAARNAVKAQLLRSHAQVVEERDSEREGWTKRYKEMEVAAEAQALKSQAEVAACNSDLKLAAAELQSLSEIANFCSSLRLGEKEESDAEIGVILLGLEDVMLPLHGMLEQTALLLKRQVRGKEGERHRLKLLRMEHDCVKEELDAVMQRKHAAERQLAEEQADRAEKHKERRDILQKFAISTTETANMKERIMDLKETKEDLMRDLDIEIATELLASLVYEQQATLPPMNSNTDMKMRNTVKKC
jgi:hypothetical protein